jgi:SAM-dependent methyltransferase
MELPARTSLYTKEHFSRKNEEDDAIFYGRDRFVSHLDSLALSTIERLVEILVVEERPAVLDLMASWDSHIPETVRPAEVVGLGLNERELAKNRILDSYVLQDINKDPCLPFPDNRFDVVLNTVSVDYMTQPFRVFEEVGRILKPGGLFLVIFSNRFFPEKVVKIWSQSNEYERIMLVEDFFATSPSFDKPKVFISKGRPRPKDDPYASMGVPSDPVYAVYAEKRGGTAERTRPNPYSLLEPGKGLTAQELEERKVLAREKLLCPHCGVRMKKWAVPDHPFSIWTNEYLYICFNDECPYLVRGWDVMNRQGNIGSSYRQMYNPERDCFMPIPVPHLKALREGIVEED